MARPSASRTDVRARRTMHHGSFGIFSKGLFIEELGFDKDEYYDFKRDCDHLVKNYFPASEEGSKWARQKRIREIAEHGLHRRWLSKLEERLHEHRAEDLCCQYLERRALHVTGRNQTLRWDDLNPPEARPVPRAHVTERGTQTDPGRPLSVIEISDLGLGRPSEERKLEKNEKPHTGVVLPGLPHSRPFGSSLRQIQEDGGTPAKHPAWHVVMLKLNYADVTGGTNSPKTQSISLSCCIDSGVLRRMGQDMDPGTREVTPEYLLTRELAKVVNEKLRAHGVDVKPSNICFESRRYGPGGGVAADVETTADFTTAFYTWWREPRNRQVNTSGLYEFWLTVRDKRKKVILIVDDNEDDEAKGGEVSLLDALLLS